MASCRALRYDICCFSWMSEPPEHSLTLSSCLLQELLRHVKREFGKLLNLLQAYAIISYGVRIICTNQVRAVA